jgi:hypothetical protein
MLERMAANIPVPKPFNASEFPRGVAVFYNYWAYPQNDPCVIVGRKPKIVAGEKQASLQAGYSAWWGYELLKMPRVEPILREFEKRKRDESWDSAKGRIVLTREFLDELFLQRLVNMKTHPRVGDLPIVKMFETGYKRTGDIQPARISAEAKAGNISQLYAKRLYLPEWRKEAIERIQSAEQQESGTEHTTEGYARQM